MDLQIEINSNNNNEVKESQELFVEVLKDATLCFRFEKFFKTTKQKFIEMCIMAFKDAVTNGEKSILIPFNEFDYTNKKHHLVIGEALSEVFDNTKFVAGLETINNRVYLKIEALFIDVEEYEHLVLLKMEEEK